MTVFSIAIVILLGAVVLLIPVGFRAGDKPHDALLSVGPLGTPRGASVTITNPGGVPVIVGLSLRRPGLRLRLEGESYVRIRTSRTTPDLLAASQAAVGVVGPEETATFSVPAEDRLDRHAELVVVIGQPERLRTIHHLVRLAPIAAATTVVVPSLERRQNAPPPVSSPKPTVC